MGWQCSRSLLGAGEARWACDAGAVRGRRSAPAGRSAQRACGAGKASGCARVLFGVRFRRSDFAVCDADASPSHLLGPFAEKRPQI